MAFYNEIDPFAANWLRRLIDAGELAVGRVSETDIRELSTADITDRGRAHFFAGIGGWDLALQLAGWPSDWPVWTGSCPCQPWSIAGKGSGKNDARHLWPDWFRLIKECHPPIIFGEQVASPAGRAWFDIVSADMEDQDYAVGAADLCACGVGAPHLRQRLYWVAIADGFRQEWSQKTGHQEGANTGTNLLRKTRGLADAGRERLNRIGVHVQPRRSQQGDAEAWRDSEACGLVDPEAPERRGTPHEGNAGGRAEKTGGPGATHPSSVGNADEPRGGWESGGVCRAEKGSPVWEEPDGAESTGPADMWSDAEWIPCTDGKARPAQPGSFPLAHGLPLSLGRLRPWERQLADVAGADVRSLKKAGRNRVGRLRGYGNAIVPELAAEFIRAVMEELSCLQ